MSWSTDDGVHEGWAACRLPDGRVSHGDQGPYVLVGPEMTPVDRSLVAAWVGMCTCGEWSGPVWDRVDSPDLADEAARKAYDSEGWVPDHVEEAIRAEWRAHVAPHTALIDVSDAARSSGLIGAKLEAAVAVAKAAGASWEKIGAAAGITKQGAHERWKSVAVDNASTPDPLEWRRLIDGWRLAPVPMTPHAAVMLARHVKAALLHLGQAEKLAEEVGIDLDSVMHSPGHDLSELWRTAYDAVHELDSWTVNNAAAAGVTKVAYQGTERWCPAEGGTLPTVSTP